QTVTKADPAPVHQQGDTVQIRPAAQRTSLAPGATEKLTLSGTYSGANPLPVEFRLGDATCGVRVSGVAGTTPSTAPATKTAPTKAPPKKTTVRSNSGSGGGAPKAKAPKPPKGPAKPAEAKGPGGQGKG
ncbi:MAG: serine/threonine protein kinase, partial [Actinoplanes sp.]